MKNKENVLTLVTSHPLSEEKIRLRAYEIWLSEGKPHGRDHEHWLQAERQLTSSQPSNPFVQSETETKKSRPKKTV